MSPAAAVGVTATTGRPSGLCGVFLLIVLSIILINNIFFLSNQSDLLTVFHVRYIYSTVNELR